MRESAARIRAIVDTTAEGIVTINERGTIESFNLVAAWIFDYAPLEVVGRNVSLSMPSSHSEIRYQYLAHYLKTGEGNAIGTRREVLGRRRDGSQLPLELSICEVRVGNRRIFTGIGIPPKKQYPIFDGFAPVDRSTTRE